MMGQVTDLRFCPHVTLFGGSSLSPDKRAGLFKTANSVLVPAVSIGSMSLREKMNDKEPLSVRVVTYQFYVKQAKNKSGHREKKQEKHKKITIKLI